MPDTPKPQGKPKKRPPQEQQIDPLAASLLAGLAQDSADPDAADARFNARMNAVGEEDDLLEPSPAPTPPNP